MNREEIKNEIIALIIRGPMDSLGLIYNEIAENILRFFEDIGFDYEASILEREGLTIEEIAEMRKE